MLRGALALLVLLVALVGCGGDEAEETAGAAPLPGVAVVDLADGRTLSLDEVQPSGRPLLVWFWAPH